MRDWRVGGSVGLSDGKRGGIGAGSVGERIELVWGQCHSTTSFEKAKDTKRT